MFEGRERQVKLWRADPVQFIKDVWPDAFLWSKLKEIARAVASSRRVVVPSGHGLGKTWLSARLALWFLATHKPAKVITTARSWDQVKNVLWSEIATAYRTAHYPIGGRLLDVEIDVASDWFAVGLSPKRDVADDGFGVSRLQGLHAENMLVVIDEAGQTSDDVLIAAQSLVVAPNNKILMIGNPSQPTGPFYEACRNKTWTKITLSCFDHPNVKEDRNLVPGAVTRDWIREFTGDNKEGTPRYIAKVLGEFPQTALNAVIDGKDIEAARIQAKDTGGNLYAGLDVGGGGDESVLIVREGGKVLDMQVWNERYVGPLVVAYCRKYQGRLNCINVDVSGIGFELPPYLREHDLEVREVNVGLPSSDPEQFANLKAELYWNLKTRFAEHAITGITDPTLVDQLRSITHRLSRRLQVEIVDKATLKTQTGGSPDRAEALMLAFAYGSLAVTTADKSDFYADVGPLPDLFGK